MLKKPGLEELVRELERDYARWEQVYMAGYMCIRDSSPSQLNSRGVKKYAPALCKKSRMDCPSKRTVRNLSLIHISRIRSARLCG